MIAQLKAKGKIQQVGLAGYVRTLIDKDIKESK